MPILERFPSELLPSRNQKVSNSMITTEAFYVCNALMAWPETSWVTARLHFERSAGNKPHWQVSSIAVYFRWLYDWLCNGIILWFCINLNRTFYWTLRLYIHKFGQNKEWWVARYITCRYVVIWTLSLCAYTFYIYVNSYNLILAFPGDCYSIAYIEIGKWKHY